MIDIQNNNSLAQQIAQVREAVDRFVYDTSDREWLTEALAALSVIERHVQDMEKALRDAEVGFNDLSLILEADGDDGEILDRAYRRACDEWRHIRAALPASESPQAAAREKGTE